MQGFYGFVHSIIDHWKNWGVTAILVGAASAGTWILARRKEWKESRRIKIEHRIESQVLQVLGNPTLWGHKRPMTGAGVPYIRAAEIAEHLCLDGDVVSDSLERLEIRGRVESSNGTFDNPAPYWRIVPR